MLDFRDGVLRRQTEWVSPADRAVRVSSTRLVSLSQRPVSLARPLPVLGGPSAAKARKDDPVASLIQATEATWVKSGSGFVARTPGALMLALSRIGTLDRTRRFVWRGAADHRWPLAPSIIGDLRKSAPNVPPELEVGRHELASIRQPRLWGLGRELGDPATDLRTSSLSRLTAGSGCAFRSPHTPVGADATAPPSTTKTPA